MSLEQLGIVDTHCHLWKIELASATGLTPDFGPLFRTFGPEDLAQECDRCGITQCILVESGKTVEEGEVMQQMAASSELVAAIVPYVDL